ncbi:MAG: ribonuclease Z, partial [Deltaproteobacteria bacterium]|nr:ribonuclease Z [Deltaproteobacteria bacterium]
LTLEESFHVNINREALKSLGLDTGPWLTAFKNEIYAGSPGDADFFITREQGGAPPEKVRFSLGSLAQKIAIITPGQKITYITDVIGSDENLKKIICLAMGSDHLFIEAAFLDQESAIAKEKYHLTAAEAGSIAREAAVKDFTLFHFSPRYNHREAEIENEALEAYRSALHQDLSDKP